MAACDGGMVLHIVQFIVARFGKQCLIVPGCDETGIKNSFHSLDSQAAAALLISRQFQVSIITNVVVKNMCILAIPTKLHSFFLSIISCPTVVKNMHSCFSC